MDEKVIKKTQDTLGKVIKKPPLTEKLLKKPPFRFLHDVVTSVIRSTGYMKGLFKDSELQSENVKEKESKVAFLQKIVDITSLATGKSLSVKPSKIVAGHEPEKTNELLQAIAEAINKGVNNDDLVKKVLGGKGDSKPSKPPSGSKKEREKEGSKDRESSADRRKKKEEKSGHRSKDRREDDRKSSADKKSSDRKSGSADKSREGSSDDKRTRSKDREDRDKDRKDRDRSKDKDRDREKEKENKERERRRRKEKEEEAKENETPAVNGEANDGTEEAPARIPRPSSAKGSRRRHRDGGAESSDEGDDDEDFKRQEERQRQERARRESDMNGHAAEEEVPPPQLNAGRRMARPSSARPAPPRIKKQDQVQEEVPNIVGAGNAPHVIVDSGINSDDDDDQFMAKEEDAPAPPEPIESRSQNEVEEDGDHGGLVKKILETKKELEGGNKAPQAAAGKRKDSDKPLISDVQRRKERELVQKEIDKLRHSIQTLTRSANPLGKIMDFVQEDLDSMQKEWEMWKKEHRENTLALQREQSITENSIQPLKAQLQELDQQITEQIDLIAAVQNSITRNDEKIAKMLGSITKS